MAVVRKSSSRTLVTIVSLRKLVDRRSVDWSAVDRYVGLLVGQSVCRSFCRSVCLSACRSVGRSVGRLGDCFSHLDRVQRYSEWGMRGWSVLGSVLLMGFSALAWSLLMARWILEKLCIISSTWNSKTQTRQDKTEKGRARSAR